MDLILVFEDDKLEFYNAETGDSMPVAALRALIVFLKHSDTDRKSPLLRKWVKQQKSYLDEIERLMKS